MIINYKFNKLFNVRELMMKLVDLNKIETAKMLIGNDP